MNKLEIIEVLEANGYVADDMDMFSADDIFDMVLTYEGIIGYASWIKRTIKNIYDVEV